ncbi:MAG: sigma-70 family RNA polymerase sigma factor [Acidobacteriia bacterium]|nr:sigma-70 family RNA polymerase sigma factor [Terriglobia bacterium]
MSDAGRIREQVIVLRCQLGETEAFRELVDLMEDRLFYYVRRFVHDEGSAYDLLQEVWITIFRKIRNLRDAGSFRPWIYRIAHDQVVTHIRREMARERAENGYREVISCESSDIGWDRTAAEEIHWHMLRLNALHREVLTLFFLEEMKYEEIAQVVGCEVGTVKSRLFNAKEALRQAMEAHKGV